MAYQAAIFDMDGTILDTLDDLTGSVNHALLLHGLPQRDREEIRQFLGNGMAYLIHRSVPEGTEAALEADVLEAHKAYYPQHCAERTCPYPGIPQLLQRLRAQGVRTAVVSNKRDENVQALVRDYFDGLFDVAVGAREGVPRKPAPDLVEIALRELGVARHEAVYIGDSDVDVATARAVGLDMVTVLWGFRDRAALDACGASCYVSQAEEIDAYVSV